MKHITTSILLTGSFLATESSVAGEFLNWHDESLTYLYGSDYKVDPSKQQTVTFEHASDWSIGDLFMFVDATKYNTEATNGAGDSRTFYGEISPRLSFGKISGTDLSFGPIKDVLLSATYEFGEDDVETYLLGPAIDLNIPGFDYFQLNAYYRKADGKRDGSGVWQITPAWMYTIPIGNSDIVIDGYLDWVVDNDDTYHANFHFNPQVKYDLAKAMGWGKRFYVGIEYDYWSDKYGIKDSSDFRTDQSVVNLLLKAHF